MPSYIADTQEEDFAELSGTFTPDELNKIMTFGSDGQADTEYILASDKEWVLVEVYNVEDDIGALGYHVFKSKVRDLTTILVNARAKALAEYTLFKITATHYKGNETADVYRGDEVTVLTIDNADISFIPPVVSWKLSINLISPINKILICDESYGCDAEWLC